MNHTRAHPSRSRPPRRPLTALLAAATLGLHACSSQPAGPRDEPAGSPRDLRGLAAAEESSRARQPQPQRTDRRIAMAAGAPVAWEDLAPSLAEAAGGQALQELVLDRMLAAELRSRGLSITAEDVARERNLVTEQIARDARAAPNEAERLLAGVRQRRGLGPTRFDRLLERTARMRRLIAGEVTVSAEELRQAYDMRHSARYRPRVITTSSDRKAAELRADLEQAPADQRALRFAELAARESTDPSAARGGLLEPISPADPAYPAALRAALPRLQPGQVSPIIAVDRGLAIVLLEEVIPGDNAPFESVRDGIEAEVRLKRERLAMDDLARRLIRAADVSVIDRSLDWSWQNALRDSAP